MYYSLCLVTLCMKVLQNGRLLKFSRRTDCWCSFSGASVTKTTALLDVYRAAVSKVMATYKNHGRISSAKRNTGQKPELSETDWRGLCLSITELLQQRWQQIFIITLKTISSKTAFTDPTSMVELQLLNLWLLKIAQNVKHMVRWVILYVVPNIRPGLHLDSTQGSV
jgi:hypothetical protein